MDLQSTDEELEPPAPADVPEAPAKRPRVEEPPEEEPEAAAEAPEAAPAPEARHAVEDEEGAPVIDVVGLPRSCQGSREKLGRVHGVIQELLVVEGLEDSKASRRGLQRTWDSQKDHGRACV